MHKQIPFKPVGVSYIDVYPYAIDSKGKILFLLLKRNESAPLPLTWQGISGKLSVGATIKQSIFDQIHKKIGVTPRRVFKVDFVNTFYDDYYDTVMMVPNAACEISLKDKILLSDLHSAYEWVASEKVQEYLLWPNQLYTINMISEMVLGNKVSKFHELSRENRQVATVK